MATSSPGAATLSECRAWFEASDTAHRLNLLDDLWSAYAGQVESGVVPLIDDPEGLRRLVGDMQALVGDLDATAGELRLTIRGMGGEAIDRALLSLLDQDPNGPRLKDELGQALAGRAFSEATIAACDYLQTHASDEIGHLQRGLDALLSGGLAQGDFKVPFKCSLTIIGAALIVVASVALGTMAGIPIGAPLIGAVAGAALGLGTAIVAVASNCGDKGTHVVPRVATP
jgi:hypothetical protein